jgi:hypothetical protein
MYRPIDCLCGLVVRLSCYRFRGPGFDFQRYQISWEVVGLERGPLSLVSATGELLGINSSGSCLEIENTVVGIRCVDLSSLSIRKRWH